MGLVFYFEVNYILYQTACNYYLLTVSNWQIETDLHSRATNSDARATKSHLTATNSRTSATISQIKN